jgi:hypothetical protein
MGTGSKATRGRKSDDRTWNKGRKSDDRTWNSNVNDFRATGGFER